MAAFQVTYALRVPDVQEEVKQHGQVTSASNARAIDESHPFFFVIRENHSMKFTEADDRGVVVVEDGPDITLCAAGMFLAAPPSSGRRRGSSTSMSPICVQTAHGPSQP